MKNSIALFAAVLFVASPANAGQAAFSAPYGIHATEHGVVIFHTNGARSDPPTCPSPLIANRFAIAATTDAGKAMISLLLTAQARGKRVSVYGTGNCNLWGDTESVSYLVVED